MLRLVFLRGFWWNILVTVGIRSIRITVLQPIPVVLNVLDICLLLSLLQIKLHVEAMLPSLIIVNRNCRCIASESDPGHLTHPPKFPTIVVGDFKVHMKVSIKQSCIPNRSISFAWTRALVYGDIASTSIKPLLLSESWNTQGRCLFLLLITAACQKTVISIFFQCGE